MKLRAYFNYCLLVISASITVSCTALKIPDKSHAPICQSTALDGLWQLQAGAKPIIRIDKGRMFFESNIPSESIAKPGSLLGKNVKLKHFPIYSAIVATVDAHKTKISFGPGEIEVLSKDCFLLKAFPNQKTNLSSTFIEVYKCVSLNNPSLLESFLEKTK